MYGVQIKQYALTRDFEVPPAWKRWAYQQGYAQNQIEELCRRFKAYYVIKVPGLTASDLGWESRFHKWVSSERQIAPLLKQEPEPERNPQVAAFYLQQMKALLK